MLFEYAGDELPRRRFLAAFTAIGAGALLPGCQTTPDGEPGKPFRIDVHHHFAPPGYSTELKALMQAHAKWSVAGLARRDGEERHRRPPSCRSSIPACRRGWAMSAGSRKIARISNEYAAQLMRDHPRPLRVVRDDSVPGRRGQPARDRVCVRHAQGRRHLSVDELQREAARRSCVLPDSRGAEPPQSRGLHAPRDTGVLRATSCRTSRSTRSKVRWTRRARW